MKDSPLIATVLIDRTHLAPLDYTVPKEFTEKIFPGMRVSVPLKNSSRKATILTTHRNAPKYQLKAIESILSEKKTLTEDLFTLAEWMSNYYITPYAKVLGSMLPASVRKEIQEKTQFYITRAISESKLIDFCSDIRTKSPKQAMILDLVLQYPKGIYLSELLSLGDISVSSIDTLVKKEILKKEKVLVDRSLLESEEFFATTPKKLNPEQQISLDQINKAIDAKVFHPHLLFGITGSGKTEIYLQAIDHALKKNLGVIMLVPEIALTMQTIERFKSRFQTRIAILHHRLSDGERFDTWHKIREGEIPIVIGARSAIFSPLPNLGLIIVDEEQEGSYKQMDEMPCYHARDIAVMRAKINNCTTVLGSATPSLETFYNAKCGKYHLSILRDRAGGANRPTIKLVDMKLDREKGNFLFSEELLQGLKKRITSGEQSILFLNRRGYYSLQVCTSCKEALKCKHCDVTLTYHKKENLLSCHLCEFSLQAPIRECPNCKSYDTLKFKGPGTEQVERSLHSIFPEIRTLRMDKDTTKHKGSHDQIFKQFRAGKADVLIGTQMIAKGLHFPSVTLVGVLNADATLNIPDFRSGETVFQLLTQVSGRSGRGSLSGEVLIQCFDRDHPTIQLASKEAYEEFYEMEIAEREEFGYPPFQRLAKLLFTSKNKERAEATANKYFNLLRSSLPKTFMIYKPAACGYARIKDKHRFQIIVKGKEMVSFGKIYRSLTLPKASSVYVNIDIDPLSTFS